VQGGDRSEGNLVSACRACNTLKGHRRVSEFLHEQPAARENFFRYAVHIWPRLRRALETELAQMDAARDTNAS
jgi:hypothetical protein